MEKYYLYYNDYASYPNCYDLKISRYSHDLEFYLQGKEPINKYLNNEITSFKFMKRYWQEFDAPKNTKDYWINDFRKIYKILDIKIIFKENNTFEFECYFRNKNDEILWLLKN